MDQYLNGREFDTDRVLGKCLAACHQYDERGYRNTAHSSAVFRNIHPGKNNSIVQRQVVRHLALKPFLSKCYLSNRIIRGPILLRVLGG